MLPHQNFRFGKCLNMNLFVKWAYFSEVAPKFVFEDEIGV